MTDSETMSKRGRSTQMLLPEPDDTSAVEQARADDARWLAAMAVIAQRHGLPAIEESDRRPAGDVVFMAGPSHVVKLYEPRWRGQCEAERAALSLVAGRLSLPTPEVEHEGELEGWPYLVLSRLQGEPLQGEPLQDRWPTLSAGERLGVARALGELVASLQAVAVTPTPALDSDWAGFLARRRAACRAQHARAGSARPASRAPGPSPR